MIRYAWKRVIVGLMAAAFTLPAAADDLDDLKRRLDAIEAENSQLRQDLDAVKTSEDVLVGQMSELAQTVDKKEDAKEQKKEDPLAFSSKWNNGWEASTKDKQFKFHVGGRVQVDRVAMDEGAKNAFLRRICLRHDANAEQRRLEREAADERVRLERQVEERAHLEHEAGAGAAARRAAFSVAPAFEPGTAVPM